MNLDPTMLPMRVNLQMPDQSLVLQKPLYGSQANMTHPIIAFTSTNDPAYKTILTWITEGAMRQSAGAATVSFLNDVIPILTHTATDTKPGAGCVYCHGVANPPANFSVLGGPTAVYQALTTQLCTDRSTAQIYRIDKNNGDADRSLVLLKPTMGTTVIHPVKLFSSNADPRYVLIYKWIAEGFPNN
jgi:hypothetical protein